MLRVAVFVLLTISLSLASPIQLIDSAGKLAPSRNLVSCASKSGEKATVVAAIGCTGTRKTNLLNAVFGTNFECKKGLDLGAQPSSNCLVSSAPGVIVICADGVRSDEEAKATALATSVCDVAVMNVYASDVGRSVDANVRALKSLFTAKLEEIAAAQKEGDEEESEVKPTPLLVIVHDCDAAADAAALKDAVTEEVESAWQEMRSKEDPLELFPLQVLPVPHPRYQPEPYMRALDAVRARVPSEGAGPSARFAGMASNAWTRLKKANPPLPSRAELSAVYAVETAYAAGVSQADTSLRSWQKAAGSGRILGGLGSKATKLYKSVMEKYDADTVSFSFIPLRAQRREELSSLMSRGVESLVKQQITALSNEALAGYKKEMRKLLNDDKLTEEADAALLRKYLFEFESKAADLQTDFMETSIEAEYEELEADLCEFSEKFGDSPAAQARFLAKMEKAVNKPKGERSFVAGLGLVGFVRQAGFGNIQAVSGYRAGPHTLTFGYANDASLPESMQDGEPPPLLRLQPKLNLDIDL